MPGLGNDLPILPVPDAIRAIADSEDRRLAWAFFIFFARIEYALKSSGRYLKAGRGRVAQPDWDRFAADHDDLFRADESEDLRAAVEYFLHEPPRKQLCRGGAIGWSAPQGRRGQEPELVWLLRSVRNVRNNLFHGGKAPFIAISEPSRDRDLLLSSLAILNACLELHPEVRLQFFAYLD